MEKTQGVKEKIFNCFTSVAQRVYLNPNPAAQPPESGDVVQPTPDEDCATNSGKETVEDEDEFPARFEYTPKNFAQRLVTGVGGKTKLASSTMISIPYLANYRWILIAALVVVTIFLTPQLLPKWLGFKWSTPSDLCANRGEKLKRLQDKMASLSNLKEGELFVDQTKAAVNCMDKSCTDVWNRGLSRVTYPGQCIPANAKEKTTSKKTCVGGQKIEVCAKKFGVKLKCKSARTPRECLTVTASDPDSVKKIAELNAQRKVQQNTVDANIQTMETDIAQTANKKSEAIINRLLIQIDIASNLYIVYTMLAIIVGTPVVIFKRDVKTRIVGSAFGLKKSNFIILIIVILTIYDSGIKMLRDTDFPQLFKNFQNDPCFLDPEFSKNRLELIRDVCGNITEHRNTLNIRYSNMTSILYDAQLCEVCEVPGRTRRADPTLVTNIENEKERYIAGTVPAYTYPGNCNATQLDEETGTPEDSGVSFARAFLGSGVLAQILLKSILASFLTHLVSWKEPMTMHRGIVEVFFSAKMRLLTAC